MSHLTIDWTSYQKGYNLNFLEFVDTDYNGLDYLSWGYAIRLLKQLHPTLCWNWEDPQRMVSTVIDNSYFQELLDGAKQEIESATSDRDRKKATKAYKALLEQGAYVSSGVVLFPYLYCAETGDRTAAIQFPVMDSANNSCRNPDARDMADNSMRSIVKAIAINTGIGYRLYTREGIDLFKKGDKQHPLYLGLMKCLELKRQILMKRQDLPSDWKDPDFGSSMIDIRNAIARLQAILQGNDIQKPSNGELPFSNPQEAWEWAAKTLNQSVEKMEQLYLEVPAINGKKGRAFYEAILSQSN